MLPGLAPGFAQQRVDILRLVGRPGLHRLQLPHFIAPFIHIEDLVRAGIFFVAAVKNIANFLHAVLSSTSKTTPKVSNLPGLRGRRPAGIGPRHPRYAGPRSRYSHCWYSRHSRRRPVVMQGDKALRRALLRVDGFVAGHDPGRGHLFRDEGLVGAGILFIAAMDDEVHRLAGILRSGYSR